MAQLVQFAGSDSGFDKRSDVVENFCGQAPSDSHFFDFSWRFECDAHEVSNFRRWEEVTKDKVRCLLRQFTLLADWPKTR